MSYAQSELLFVICIKTKFLRVLILYIPLLLYKKWNKIFIYIPFIDVHENKSFVPLQSDRFENLSAIHYQSICLLFVNREILKTL